MNKSRSQRRKVRTRNKLNVGTARPRLSVDRTNKYVYAQIIDDAKGKTLVAAKSDDPVKAGAEIAKAAKAKKITTVVFDRGAYKYHGRVKLLADAAREGGLKF